MPCHDIVSRKMIFFPEHALRIFDIQNMQFNQTKLYHNHGPRSANVKYQTTMGYCYYPGTIYHNRFSNHVYSYILQKE